MKQKFYISLILLSFGFCAFAQDMNTNTSTPKTKNILSDNVNENTISVNEFDASSAITSNDINIYPNPAQGKTHLKITLNESSNVEVTIINMVGKTVMLKDLGRLSRGNHEFTIELYNLSPGMYIVNTKVGSQQITKRLNIVQ